MKQVSWGASGKKVSAVAMGCMRLEEIARAAEVDLSREHWYRLYLAAGYSMP